MKIKGLATQAMLIILDGFGINEDNNKNAIKDAKTPHLHRFALLSRSEDLDSVSSMSSYRIEPSASFLLRCRRASASRLNQPVFARSIEQ